MISDTILKSQYTYQKHSGIDIIFFMKKVQITIVPRELGQLIDQMLDKMLTEVTNPPEIHHDSDLRNSIQFDYDEDYDVHQGKCYQQFSPNLCGYHAIFNTFCVLKIINGGVCEYNINSAASFWKFKLKVESFLTQYKRKHKKPDEWPWRVNDILVGDFQRTYNKVCMEQFKEFDIFKKHQNFYYMTDTWEFQYQNLLGSEIKIMQLSNKFAQFRLYSGDKPLVLHLMLAITTHWLTFIAVNVGGFCQYWFFDSNNYKYLNFSWEEIQEFIEMKSKERTKYKKQEYTNFQKQSWSMCLKDIQTSLKLIIGALKGTESLEAYAYNRKFDIFANHLQQAIDVGHSKASFVIRDYQHNIRTFFTTEIQWHLFSEKNNTRMKKMFEYSKAARRQSKEGQYFYSLLRIHNRM